MTYKPYSQRHNITDPSLAGLLDYLEREMGWEIRISHYSYHGGIVIEYSKIASEININFSSTSVKSGGFTIIGAINSKLFFRTYKTLLPVIMDLYAK